MKIDIIGAGIGGLTTAIALKKKGIAVRIHEQASAFKPIGAGIILANNAMQVYQKLGLKDKIEARGNHISAMCISKADLSPISSIELKEFEQKYGVKNIAIHRGALQGILLEELGDTEIHLNKKLVGIQQKETYELNFEDRKQENAQVLIGADGINSNVRKSLFPDAQIRQANQLCWRGITNFQLPQEYQHKLYEAWGKGSRFGFVQIASNTVYWYALKSFKHDLQEIDRADFAEGFSAYAPLVNEILATTPSQNIYKDEITDLKPISTWHKENVCLIGDAAHATTPNMGQGACQAIEDAYFLSESLAKYPTQDAFREFESLRMKKAKLVVNNSWQLGKLAHLENPIGISLRNTLMKLTPSWIAKQQSARIFELSYVS